jgi:Response regulators consisting of a CheY-like receiver domain and a winged-helix DNA-binding domain
MPVFGTLYMWRKQMKILIIDDEELLVKGISYNLENEGYQVVTGTNGADAVRLAQDPEVRLIVLDVMMPVMDGLEACRRIRQFSNVPIIMLTAKTEDMDKLLGFDYGADDYLTKPFNILELKARIRAILRRTAKQEAETRIVRGSIALDSQSRNTYKNGVAVDLTAKEFDLVELLIRNPNRVYSRESLLDIIWGDDYRSDIRTVDVHIRRIREKLERDPANPEHILTKWGVGYYFKV